MGGQTSNYRGLLLEIEFQCSFFNVSAIERFCSSLIAALKTVLHLSNARQMSRMFNNRINTNVESMQISQFNDTALTKLDKWAVTAEMHEHSNFMRYNSYSHSNCFI